MGARVRTILMLGLGLLLAQATPATTPGPYKNLKAAIYVPVTAVRQLKDPKIREQQYRRIAGQLRFDKVYLETYRSNEFADDATLESVKKFFVSKGVAVAAGIAFSAASPAGQFVTLDYEDPHDRAMCQHAVELAARHFDEIILDDFFFYNTKSDADIAARGDRNWTQYRLEKMRQVAEELVLKPARAANPRVHVTIKYPNWYEHFQGLGYDLDLEAKKFDSIYTGNETRDPQITDQLLQQYESYLVFRYFDHVRPGGKNLGGWVDTYDTRYVERYSEQLWDTLFARAPEITLFNWPDLARNEGTDWAHVAGESLRQVDPVLGHLGKPRGIASYKPFQSHGEDFLQNYLGNIGLPIELTPEFPDEASLILLTQSASHDPDIVAKIEHHLAQGGSIVITSGLLRALQGKGLDKIIELEYPDRKVAVHDFIGGFGAGRGTSLNEPGKQTHDIVFPDMRFYTNDSWPIIRGVANNYGVPILLMNRYSRGVFYVLNVPDNPGDLYALPQPVLTALRTYLQADLPVRIDAPSHVALFVYDNGTFIVQSFRSEPVTVTLSAKDAHSRIHDVVSGETLTPESSESNSDSQANSGDPGVSHSPESPASPGNPGTFRGFKVQLPPHSYRVFAPTG
jgi:hypothetical protein